MSIVCHCRRVTSEQIVHVVTRMTDEAADTITADTVYDRIGCDGKRCKGCYKQVNQLIGTALEEGGANKKVSTDG